MTKGRTGDEIKWNEINSNILYLNSAISIGTLNQYSLSTPIQYQKFSKKKMTLNIALKLDNLKDWKKTYHTNTNEKKKDSALFIYQMKFHSRKYYQGWRGTFINANIIDSPKR